MTWHNKTIGYNDPITITIIIGMIILIMIMTGNWQLTNKLEENGDNK